MTFPSSSNTSNCGIAKVIDAKMCVDGGIVSLKHNTPSFGHFPTRKVLKMLNQVSVYKGLSLKELKFANSNNDINPLFVTGFRISVVPTECKGN